MGYEVILFDLDGTLTDPKLGITKSVQYALAKFNIHEPDLDKLVPFIGPPLVESFQEFYALSEEAAVDGVGYYREYFTKAGIFENAVYPGIKDMLTQLTAQGKRLIVATSKPTVFSEQIIEHFELKQFFEMVVGSNLDGSRIHKAEIIAFILAEIGAFDCKNIVMVGDRMHDIVGAQKNDIDSIAVKYGYGTETELVAEKPTYLVRSVSELTELLQK
ncbi:MAG: 5-nucleotidase [Firmicutes bacterium]|nr:5-nucleotidase [Bacillota bacterium]